jgi:LysR family nitrogen assimilation transcriptional regulator
MGFPYTCRQSVPDLRRGHLVLVAGKTVRKYSLGLQAIRKQYRTQLRTRTPKETTMDLKQLRYFSAIAEAGSLSKASERLHVAQPALSFHLSRLEREMGVVLMQRTNRGIVLTEHGVVFLKHATRILKEVTVTVTAFKSCTAAITGNVAIGLPTSTPDAFVRRFLERSNECFPAVSLMLSERNTNQLETGLLDGTLDFAILLARKPTIAFEIEHLLFDNYMLVGPPGGEQGNIEFSEVCQLPLLLPRDGVAMRDRLEAVARSVGTSLLVAHELDSARFLKNGTLSGRGHTILPWASIREDVERGVFSARRIVNPEVRSLLCLASSLVKPPSHAREAVRATLLDLVKQMVMDGDWSGEVFHPNTQYPTSFPPLAVATALQ